MTKTKKEPKEIKLADICCPYFDKDAQKCSHPDCIRMPGCACKFCNKNK